MRGDKHILRRSSSAKAFIFRLAEEAIRNGAAIYWAPERDTVLVRLAGGGYASCSREALSITDGRLETIWCCPTGNGAGASVRKCADGVEVRLFSGRRMPSPSPSQDSTTGGTGRGRPQDTSAATSDSAATTMAT